MIQQAHSVEIIRYVIPTAQQPAFEAAYKQAETYLRESPACLGYQFVHGVEDADHYLIIIYWKSIDDHLDGFRKSAQFPPFFALVKPFFNAIQEMKHYSAFQESWFRS